MPLRVLVIDDSAYSRKALEGLLTALPDVEEITTAVDGFDGLKQALRSRPDLIVLDLEMPGMDGLTFLRLIKEASSIPVIVVTGRKWEAEARKAIGLGAVDFIEKPAASAAGNMQCIKNELARKVGMIPRMTTHRRGNHVREGSAPSGVIVIGASTGGPKAATTVARSLKNPVDAAIVLAIHMPNWLTVPFVERLRAEVSVEVGVAKDDSEVEGGRITVIPGGFHASFSVKGGKASIKLTQGVKGDLYAPSIDAVFQSAAAEFGQRLTAIVMTGMGSDGKAGAKTVKDRGGYVIAESSESAVVYGMPGAAISAGVVDEVLSAEEIGGWVRLRYGRKALKLA